MRRANGDGTAAKKRKDGVWYRTVVIDGKRRFVYGNSEQEVNKKFRSVKEQKNETVAKTLKRMTVEEYMMHWLTVFKRIELKPKSYDTLEGTIIHQIVPHFKGHPFFTLTHDDIQKFINALDKQSCSYSITRKAYLALNACCKFAMVKDQLVRNPCFQVKLPKKAEKDIKVIQS